MSVRDRIRRMEAMAQEKEAAADDRGRSPGGVSMASNTSASGSPRPLSKVRTSFVAIADKEGRIGLARQPSGDSSISDRKLSGDTNATSSSILLDGSRANVLSSSPDALRSDRNRGPSGSFSRPSIQNSGAGPEPSAAPPTASPSSGPVPGAAATSAEPKPPTASTPAGPVPAATGSVADPSSRAATTTGPVSDSSLAVGQGQKGLAASPQIRKAPRSEEAAGQRPGGGKPGQGVQKSEAQPAPDQSQAQAKGSENPLDRSGHKDRSLGRTGGPGGTAVAGTTALNGADKAKTTKPAPASSTQPKTTGKAPEPKGLTTPVAERKPAEKKATPSNVSPPFVKPRPKSPTQPVKLPERLTTHTGASAARSKNAPPLGRPPSRTSGGTSGKSLGRSASVAGRQHASFGPPPKQAVDHPVLKKEHKVDEGFLARMMRPTQAYANKVADKAQLPPKTPPRATATKKPASSKTGPAKKAGPRSTTTSAAASPETSKNEQSSAVKQAAKRGISIAEESITVKKTEKKEPVVKASKKEGQTKEPLKTSEKTNLSKPVETKVEVLKPAEKENIVKVAETEKEAPEANEHKENASKMFGQKEEPSKPSEQQESLNASQLKQDVSNTAEKSEPAPSASNGKKASDAMFEAFMNPGSDQAKAPQANGHHTTEEKTNGSSGNAEAEKASSASSNVFNGIQTAPPTQIEEQEEW